MFVDVYMHVHCLSGWMFIHVYEHFSVFITIKGGVPLSMRTPVSMVEVFLGWTTSVL